MDRRTFIGRAGSAAVGLSIIPLASCDNTGFVPVIEGSDVSFLTPSSRLYTQFGAEGALDNWPGAQQIENADWTVRIEGLVSNPLTLNYEDLITEDATTVVATLRCILDNNDVPGLIGTCTWTGVPLSRFLERAGIDRESARRVRFFGRDGFTDNLTCGKVFGEAHPSLAEPMLVYGIGKQPLDAVHGGPVRLLVPGHYGHKSVKWIDSIEVTESDEVFGTYQQVRGYGDDGMVQVTSKLTSHLRGATIPAGPTRLTGFAYGGAGQLAKIEIAIDGGPFEEARIIPIDEILTAVPELSQALQLRDSERFQYPFHGVWTLWEYRWEAQRGDHTIRMRATDATGLTQPETDDDPTNGDNPILEVGLRVE